MTQTNPSSTPLVFIAGLAEPRGGAAKSWLDAAAHHALAYSLEVFEHADATEVMAVRVVATSIWQTSGGQPSWGTLDLEHCLALARRVPLYRHEGIEGLLLTINTFYCFLNKHRLVDNRDAVRISDELEPLVAPIIARHLERHHQLAGYGLS